MPWGLSPLARGTFREQFKHHGGGRLIPAHAGNTSFSRLNVQPVEAHPRSRGEHWGSGQQVARDTGSSPLARGTPRIRPHGPRLRRLIPAHAGNTARGIFTGAVVAAHPRSRGEHGLSLTLTRSLRGSSPLARGARLVGEPFPGSHRLIPAHAGSTPTAASVSVSLRAHPRSRGEHHRSSCS